MLDTLDARLAQARAGDLVHLEFLEVLCEGEIARRAAKSLGERVRRARFEERVTLEEFDFSFNPKVPAALIRDLAALRFVAGGHSVILYEPVGVGKTHVAQALGHAACGRGHSVLFAKCARVFAEPDGGTELPANKRPGRWWASGAKTQLEPDARGELMLPGLALPVGSARHSGYESRSVGSDHPGLSSPA